MNISKTYEAGPIQCQKQNNTIPTTIQTDRTKSTSSEIQLKSGNEMVRELGILNLGGQKQLDEWASRGLVVSDEAITRSFEAFNQGFKEASKIGGAGATTSINRHQIIINSQDVPDWFHDSYQLEIKRLFHVDKNVANAFNAGNEYYTEGYSKQNQPPSAINAYMQIARL